MGEEKNIAKNAEAVKSASTGGNNRYAKSAMAVKSASMKGCGDTAMNVVVLVFVSTDK